MIYWISDTVSQITIGLIRTFPDRDILGESQGTNILNIAISIRKWKEFRETIDRATLFWKRLLLDERVRNLRDTVMRREVFFQRHQRYIAPYFPKAHSLFNILLTRIASKMQYRLSVRSYLAASLASLRKVFDKRLQLPIDIILLFMWFDIL